MERLDAVRDLVYAGRFRDALAALEGGRFPGSGQTERETLRAELLERTGRYHEAQLIAERLLRIKGLPSSNKSACEFALGLIDWDAGNTEVAIAHFQRAVSHAQNGNDLFRVCWAQLRLMVVLAGRSEAAAAVQLFADLRANVTKLGDPVVTSALHILLGEMEAKRGLTASAKRHTILGQRILDSTPNLWLEAVAENNHVALALIQSDFDGGIAHANKARAASEESGAAAMIRACVGNLGNLYFLAGDFERAIGYFEHACNLLPSTGEYSNGGLDSLARTYLLQGDIDRASEYLSRIEQSIRTDADRVLYANRYAELTCVELLMRRHEWEDALSRARRVIALASTAGDTLLVALARTREAEILGHLNRPQAASVILEQVATGLNRQAPELSAHYELAFAETLASLGQSAAAAVHFRTSQRIFRTLNNVPGLSEADRAATASHRGGVMPVISTAPQVLQATATLLLYAGRPELVASGAIAILEDAQCVGAASAVAVDPDGNEEILLSFGTMTKRSEQRTLPLGDSRGRSIQLRAQLLDDIESRATFNAIILLLGTVRDLEAAHAEREERLTLWPIEELPADDDDAVVLGKMRELMSFARKVARTNVSVLITGESGTGKEVLARAIHRFSTRADKPFIPVNCTAVPRELLESQLFGYRRGAFTGAERDSLGMIRAAQDGTMFLDEIGELGLELQPKLLRFLESGEINPLGDPSPFRVNVRILAATNANLEHLVQQGKFREDLFYRLNVIRLSIPPLRDRRDEIPALVHHLVAKAAAEFGKGRVRVSEDAMEHLVLYPWPGNIRQLHNELRRMVALAEPDTVLMPNAISAQILRATPRAARHASGLEIAVPLQDKLTPTLSRIEREMIKVALRAHHGRVEAAAKALGISRKGLYLKRQRLGL